MAAMRYAVCLLLLVVAFPSAPAAAPEAELWERWTAHDPASTLSVDHTPWNDFLETHVVAGGDGVNRVRYGAVDAAARDGLEFYLSMLTGTEVSRLGHTEQLAFWINLYNLLTVRVILDHQPVKSIRDIDISPGFFADGPWGKPLATIEGEAVSLDDIEHRIPRPIWRDPRIHYAVNCASIGCPNLEAEAFTAENTLTLLERAAQAYVNHPRGASVGADGALVVSSIYEWFKADFGGTDRGVIDHLMGYAEPPLRARLETVGEIDDDAYDWSLNAAQRTGRQSNE